MFLNNDAAAAPMTDSGLASYLADYLSYLGTDSSDYLGVSVGLTYCPYCCDYLACS